MPNSTFTHAPGFHDRIPQEAIEAETVMTTLQQAMARFGYQLIETPLVEYADLFLTKAGDDAVNRLFNFEMYGRQLCLRSEFTASAARLYVERYQHEPKPIRWQVNGPVFRYESVQRSHSRQFTMLGAEMIGSAGAGSDAEMMGLAAHGLFAAGLHDWTLVIGHVGLVGQLLERFDLDRRTRRFVLGQMENLHRPDRGRTYVEQQIGQLYSGFDLSSLPVNAEGSANLSESSMSRALQVLLGTTPAGGRSNEDIARRLLDKQRYANQHQEILRALDFLEALTAIEGPPSSAFAALNRLLPADESARETARIFRAAVDLLSAYGVESDRIRLQMGLVRGLNYYTGIVFEAHTQLGDSASQLCGGGRYDDFISVLGASQDTPAVGLAFGLERILQELHRHQTSPSSSGIKILVTPVEDDDNPEAARIATALRQHTTVELYTPPTQNLSQALGHANKRHIPYVIIIGEAERAADYLTVRDMQAGTQFTCALHELTGKIDLG